MTRKTQKKYLPRLRFSPYAWAKLLFLRDQGLTEIGGFGIAKESNPLFIEDVVLIRQSSTAMTVKFDDAAVADFFDEQIDLGRRPEQFARVWIHTHPGDSAEPSLTDEKTFGRAFGHCEWAVMAILARGGASYARLRFNKGPKADVLIPTLVEWPEPFPGSDQQGWLAEYRVSVNEEVSLLNTSPDCPVEFDGWDEQELPVALW